MPISDFSATMNDPMYGKASVTAYTGTAGNSPVLAQGCGAVWIYCTSAAHVKIGVGAVATTDVDFPVPANAPMVLPVKAEGSRVSAVQATGGSGGSIYVGPLFA